ncbi:MAG TPA: tetratricopeptide repeat protein [Usitatibacteraceae bacterium]|nr:tetratricopeptide repeat protein [Usitatibacteraceae bacterium]
MSGSYDFEEQERIAAIHHWWEDNAKFVYAAIAAFVLAVGGWRGWLYWSAVQSEDAAAMVAELAKARGDAKRVADIAQAVIDKHPRTFFASEAALVSAQASFEAGDLATAQSRLEWVMANGRDEHRGIARIRLAAVLLDLKKYAEALQVLEANKDEAWAAMAADLKGDILFAQGRLDEARAAYKLAIDKSDQRSPLRSVTELKLGALGGAQ